MATIVSIKARQIFDSRGNPTVEVRFFILLFRFDTSNVSLPFSLFRLTFLTVFGILFMYLFSDGFYFTIYTVCLFVLSIFFMPEFESDEIERLVCYRKPF